MKLRGPDFWTWTGLRRVNCRAVTRFEDEYYEDGRPFPGCLYPILIESLLEQKLLDLSDPDEQGWQRVVLSEAGRAEYQALCRRRQQKKTPQPTPTPRRTPALPETESVASTAYHRPRPVIG